MVSELQMHSILCFLFFVLMLILWRFRCIITLRQDNTNSKNYLSKLWNGILDWTCKKSTSCHMIMAYVTLENVRIISLCSNYHFSLLSPLFLPYLCMCPPPLCTTGCPCTCSHIHPMYSYKSTQGSCRQASPCIHRYLGNGETDLTSIIQRSKGELKQ